MCKILQEAKVAVMNITESIEYSIQMNENFIVRANKTNGHGRLQPENTYTSYVELLNYTNTK